LCRTGTFFSSRWTASRGYEPWWDWIPNELDALKANLQPGDALAVAQIGGLWDIGVSLEFLDNVVLPELIRPHGAHLVMIGDNPLIDRHGDVCEAIPDLCHILPEARDFNELQRADVEAALTDFERRHAAQGDVHFFSQRRLWDEGAPGEHLWGNVPGTTTRGYDDTNHLMVSVAVKYLGPYMCSAFFSWGL